MDNVPDTTIENPRDAVIRVTSTAICGSDLHLYDGVVYRATSHRCEPLLSLL